jgi:hypothetical protein
LFVSFCFLFRSFGYISELKAEMASCDVEREDNRTPDSLKTDKVAFHSSVCSFLSCLQPSSPSALFKDSLTGDEGSSGRSRGLPTLSRSLLFPFSLFPLFPCSLPPATLPNPHPRSPAGFGAGGNYETVSLSFVLLILVFLRFFRFLYLLSPPLIGIFSSTPPSLSIDDDHPTVTRRQAAKEQQKGKKTGEGEPCDADASRIS